ncbi:MAG: CDGSH iron-sulfur domain-containing protein [Candidatus Schekmanbacteria bacterium]|nr:CDGSH iron-sulfur domain-containing protein [Candidatus Schekmanbacteria bacterium]
MSEPTIAGRRPTVVVLPEGTYYWCACGKSRNQPYCDGSHKGSGFAPIPFTLTEENRVALCMCKHSCNKPFCDGTHRTLA